MSTETEEQKLQDIVGLLSKLTVLELSKLKTALEDTWGVTAAAPAAVMAPAAAAEAAPAAEATDFKVVLEKVGSNKIAVIKAVREITQLGLKEAKKLVDEVPSELVASAPKQQAEEFAKKITDAGGEVSLKGIS
ncbi:MAG: 50S ribosomal protein L7/L12 [Chlamydiota bacterium]